MQILFPGDQKELNKLSETQHNIWRKKKKGK